LVFVTRRDYGSHDVVDSPGSTPHTDDELEDIKAGRGIFLQRLGLEVANFLLWFAETHKIPMISDDRKSGGISVMGWSLGAVSRQQLALYFRQGILYSAFIFHRQSLTCCQYLLDPAEASFGYYFGHEDGIYPASLADFAIFASTYYTHADLTSRAGAGATTIDLSKPPSFKNMTNEDLPVTFDIDASMKGDVPMCLCMLPAYNSTLASTYIGPCRCILVINQRTFVVRFGQNR